jgi:hypothetical protein
MLEVTAKVGERENKQVGHSKMAYKYSDASTVSNASKKLTLRDYLNLNQLSSKKKESRAKMQA